MIGAVFGSHASQIHADPLTARDSGWKEKEEIQAGGGGRNIYAGPSSKAGGGAVLRPRHLAFVARLSSCDSQLSTGHHLQVHNPGY